LFVRNDIILEDQNKVRKFFVDGVARAVGSAIGVARAPRRARGIITVAGRDGDAIAEVDDLSGIFIDYKVAVGIAVAFSANSVAPVGTTFLIRAVRRASEREALRGVFGAHKSWVASITIHTASVIEAKISVTAREAVRKKRGLEDEGPDIIGRVAVDVDVVGVAGGQLELESGAGAARRGRVVGAPNRRR
jgi:hypothetical protein